MPVKIPPFEECYTVDASGCWLWQRRVSGDGYGWYGRAVAHIYSYRHHVGMVPVGHELDHRCRVRHCVNPAHLEAVTHRENVLRGQNPMAKLARRTHCDQGHEFTPENIGREPGRRRCLECQRVRSRAKYARKVGQR